MVRDRCSEVYAISLDKCPACRAPREQYGRVPGVTAADAVPSSTSAGSGSVSSHCDSPVQAAHSASSNLKSAAMVLAILGVVGGVIMVIFGLITQCPAGMAECYCSEKSINIALIATGVVGALIWWWIYAVSNAIAARVALAAHEARNK